MKEKYLCCECHSLDHLIHFGYWDDDEWPELFITIQLSNYNNFFKRLWCGLKYAFGYECRFGHWDEILLWREKATELRDFLDQFLEDTEDKVR